MWQRARAERWLGLCIVLVLAAVTVGIGFCLADGHQHDMGHHGMAADLCLGFLALAVVVTLLGLAAMDRLPAELMRPISNVSLHRLDPPPKPTRIS